MTPERWKQVEEVFQTALDLEEGEERAHYVEQACAGDEELRGQVEALVAQYEASGDFIEEPALAVRSVAGRTTDPNATNPISLVYEDPSLGRRIGAYRLVREIGRGGMGAVYLAERAESDFRRSVAVKLIKRGMDTDFILRRFRNERQILATLDHTYIARLLDGGTTDDGLPYFVMEYIDGLPVYRYCDENTLTIRERLRLFRKVCDAVHYAHRQLVIHRDIKPSNILVTPDGAPKLLDFGIAKLLNPELAGEITLDPTATAMRLMTPEYASPEQVRGQPVTPATDVYSLGVLLYELLTGHRPYRVRHRAPHEMARVICEEEPPHPSVRIASPEDLLPAHSPSSGEHATLSYLYWSRGATVESLRSELSGDLDRIVMKALRKEPLERYQSAEEMRDDITRHLEGKPVMAPPSVSAAPRTSGPLVEPITDERSLAILPLRIIDARRDGGETGDEYLGVGLADALITRLSGLRRFALRPTSSVLRYGSEDTDPLAAGRELGVGYVLEGRIRRWGERIRVTTQLLDVRAGTTVWAGQFDESYTDVLSLEDAISEQVAEAIVPQLTGGERERLHRRGTDNNDAFEAYMRGRFHWNTFSEEGFAKAIVCYHQAIANDPSYAVAYAGVAEYYNWLGIFGVLPFRECSAAAKEASSKAVELDPTLAEGYAALSLATLCHDFDWERAEELVLRAIDLNPTYSAAHLWYSFQLTMEGRFDAALEEGHRAEELDPFAFITRYNVAWLHYKARRYSEAAALSRRAIEAEPHNGMMHFCLSFPLSRMGEHEEAINAARRGVELNGKASHTLSRLACAYAAAGRTQEAEATLVELNEIAHSRSVSPYHIALIHCALGRHERALELLEEAFTTGDAWILWAGVEPELDPLRGDTRFRELLRLTDNPAARSATSGDAQTPAAQRSIAVLPLRVVGHSPADGTGDEYLGVGLADALITRLSNVRRFVVRPTSSVLRFDRDERDSFEAGRDLGVEFVLDGRVQRAGERLRVSVQLLDVGAQTSVWADAFNEPFTDVLSIQDAISTRVAEALIPRLSGDERRRLSKRGTDSSEAFESYLRGRYHLALLTPDNLARAVGFFERAVALDPTYALAYAGLADCFFCMAAFSSSSPAEVCEPLRQMAQRAIALDDTLGEAYAVLGIVTDFYDLDRAEAERLLRRALQLTPNYPTGHVWYSVLSAGRGNFDLAISEARRAVELDPLSAFNQQHLGWTLYHARRFDEALAQTRKVVETDPNFGHARAVHGWLLRREGRFDEAVAEGRRAVELSNGATWIVASLAATYAKAGRKEEARALLRELTEAAAVRFVSPFCLALVHLHLGERAMALAMLEEALAVRDVWLVWLTSEPQLDALRDDSRYAELLRRMSDPTTTGPVASKGKQTIETPASGRLTGESLTGATSVAVLPLSVLAATTGGTGEEYLGVGLADALITRLSNVRSLTVRPTSSVLRHRGGEDTDALEAGRALQVDYVIGGTIRRAGERIRVTAQLLNVSEGATRWACSFDENYTDVLQLEDSFSEQVAAALIPHLTGEERRQVLKRATDNNEAFESYLRGRFHWNTFTEEGFSKAIVCYQRAIAADPSYALAHAGVADYYNLLGVLAAIPFAESSKRAREAALKAVALDPALAEGYAALGLATLTHDFDWDTAGRHLRRAVELNPNYVTGHLWLCYYLGMAGRFDEALAEARRGHELDPLTPLVHHTLNWTLYHARRFDESIVSSRALAAAEPNYGLAQVFLCLVLWHTGEYDESIEAGRRGVELLGRTPYTLSWLASAYAAAGRVEESRALLEEIEQMSSARYASPYLLAMVHCNLGDRERALAELERALAIRDGRLAWLGVDPQFDPLRDEPRFKEILRRTNNPATRTGRTGAAPSHDAPQLALPTSPVEQQPPVDAEAKQLYVAGRYYATRRTAEGLRQGIERFEQAVKRAPQFALAHAEMADCYALLNWYVEPPPADAWERAKRAALNAVEADPALADGHASLGFVLLHHDRDFRAAETELRRAIELKPDNGVARRWHAFNLSAMGRHDEAFEEIIRAREVLPNSPVMATAVANVLFLARRFDEAIAQCRRALELDPGSVAAHVVLRWSYERKGMREEALAVYEQERVFAGDTPTTRAKRAHVLAATGDHAQARSILEEIIARREEHWVTAYEIAVIYSLLNDRDQAFRWLNAAVEEHAVGFTFARVDPHLDNLRTDPRFDELLRSK